MKKKVLTIFVAVLVGLAIAIILALAGNDDTPANTPSSSSSDSSTNLTLDAAFLAMQKGIADLEEASSARVDKIAMIAKEHAKGITDDLGNEACAFIIEAFPNFFTDNETMEKIMYCGYLLEYGYPGSNAETLGQDVYQSVKYVYRGVESISDESTQANLRQIKNLLDKQLG